MTNSILAKFMHIFRQIRWAISSNLIQLKNGVEFRIWATRRGQATHMGGYYFVWQIYIPSMECLTQEGTEVWPFEFKNLKNIFMKYRATIGVVGVVCIWVCPGMGGVCSTWDSRWRSYLNDIRFYISHRQYIK